MENFHEISMSIFLKVYYVTNTLFFLKLQNFQGKCFFGRSFVTFQHNLQFLGKFSLFFNSLDKFLHTCHELVLNIFGNDT
jgi:hypothetical protein